MLVIAPQFFSVMPFKEGLARVGAFFKSDPINGVVGNYGYIDRTGRFAVAPTFDWGEPFSEGLACVSQNEKSGFIDTKGNVAIPFRFESCRSFLKGLSYKKKSSPSQEAQRNK